MLAQIMNYPRPYNDLAREGPFASRDYNNGLKSDEGVPIAQIIVSSLNSLMYLTIVVVIFTKSVRVTLWKKAMGAALTLPEHVGLAIWLREDNETNRHIYLYCQYFSYFSLIVTAVYHFLSMIGYYIITQDGVTEVELSVTGASLVLYGVFGTFFLMSF